jgi:dihydroorotate dehydrogenase (NAD+) catalytic subunit
VDDIAWLASRLSARGGGPRADLSCPDRGRGGLPIGLDVGASELATVSARAATDLPLIVKLTPLAGDIRELARAVAAAGADAISAIGPLPALAIDERRRHALLGTSYGWLSGPALKPVALRVVYDVQVVRIPIVGIGGISNLDDVLDFLAAGATVVGIATAALADPALPGRLGAELDAWCAREHIDDLRELVGTALPRRRDRGSLRAGAHRP